MAEAALLLVISKIGIAVAAETLKYARPLLAKKSKLVAALPDDMRLIKNDLELIHAYLKDIGRRGRTDGITETWIGQARKLAFDMEDIVDQFIYVVGKHHQEGSWWGHVKKIAQKPRYLFTLDEIANKLHRINRELTQLKQNRDWTQNNQSLPIAGVSDDIPAADYDSQYTPGQDYSIPDDELVGFDKNKKTLIKLLSFKDGSPLRMIALWGMGGIGKSTLVKSVYKKEKDKFECHAWVSVSQSYKLDDIWRDMLKGISPTFDAQKLSTEQLQGELKKILGEKRYLIILDDVWKAADLFQIKTVLAHNTLGSRVIITTRFDVVASIADDGCKMKVEALDRQDAWSLFCRKAFPRAENYTCPTELLEEGKNIVEKCGGLPLALVAIGSILSLTKNSVNEWKLFYNKLTFELHNNDNLSHVERILNLSYKYLPSYLKSCFLYCAMFPEDYKIHKNGLIRMWIAEGFIEQSGESSLEDVAEGYVIELVQRSMLQVARLSTFHRIRYLQMHDVVRELAIFQSTKESFSKTYDGGPGELESDSRRVSVVQCRNRNWSIISLSRLRTFISFDTNMPACPWLFSECKYLAVLELSNLPIETIPNSIGELFNLKYLGLKCTKVKNLPKTVSKLHNLETLNLNDTECVELPRGSRNLKRLRHLHIRKWLDRSYLGFKTYESLEPFKGLWDLKELQILHSVRASKVLVAKLADLSQLRVLFIHEVRSSYCAELCHSLSKMHHLSKLQVRSSNEDEVLQLDTLTLSNPLQKLFLIGRFTEGTLKSPFFSTHGNQPLRLELFYSQLARNPLPRLSKFTKLNHLGLTRAYTGQELNFRPGWFPNLSFLGLHDLPVNKICIDEGALVQLERIWLRKLTELRDVPAGIQSLKSLRLAIFHGMLPEFKNNLPRAKLDRIQIIFR
ncbi:hypothetical protein QYE76_027241 [Lolium multiflorum]|uniref:Uncharacterized protein n=1 Tax=Lolium multiflorum TaxID=4521 RepID=A0AAD8Q6E8_LOLMU|nr:hypothetical protein QYE76_027241 [Lolium multiflorum]